MSQGIRLKTKNDAAQYTQWAVVTDTNAYFAITDKNK